MKKLQRITACFAFIFNVEYNSLRGLIDTKEKIQCAVIARDLLGLSWRELGVYFNINKKYLEHKAQDLRIEVELNDVLFCKLQGVQKLWSLMNVDGLNELNDA
ncbi:hypothetical protein [Patiriisocius marinus]|uniref:hypothetical protein n=1 Tax=Patiriisocius marinus TaxID=1397112 RepID=UPI00232E1E9C|nr:hypothetical protein [Patiriisocius marinus]